MAVGQILARYQGHCLRGLGVYSRLRPPSLSHIFSVYLTSLYLGHTHYIKPLSLTIPIPEIKPIPIIPTTRTKTKRCVLNIREIERYQGIWTHRISFRVDEGFEVFELFPGLTTICLKTCRSTNGYNSDDNSVMISFAFDLICD